MGWQEELMNAVNSSRRFKDLSDEQKELVMKQILDECDNHDRLYTKDKTYLIREL